MRHRLLSLATALALPLTANAAVFNVTTIDAGGPGSLRQALLDANASGDTSSTIAVDAGLTGTITPQFLSSDLPLIDVQDLTINGSGMDQLTLDLSNLQRLTLTATVDRFEVRDITIRGGLGFRGGCLNSEFGAELSLYDIAFEACAAVPQGAESARGGAIYSTGPTTLENAVLADNHALGEDGGGAEGGALFLLRTGASDSLSVRRSVFQGNVASSEVNGASVLGGAIRILGNTDVLIEESSFRLNSALLNGTGSGASGGAINGQFNELVLRRNLFRSNSSSGSASAVAVGNTNAGARPPTDIENNTFWENQGNSSLAVNNGAALSVFRSALRMRNNTFRDNDSASGAGSFFYGGEIDLIAVANNAFDIDSVFGTSSCGLSPSASVDNNYVGGFNFFTDASCTYFASTGSQHPTLRFEATSFPASAVALTLIPIGPSPVIDAAAPATSATDWTLCAERDQVGSLRPQDSDDDGVARCSAGAGEAAFFLPDGIFADGFEVQP